MPGTGSGTDERVVKSLAGVAKGTLQVGAGIVASLILGVALRIVLARTLGADDIGVVDYAVMLSVVASGFAQVGLGEGLARYVGMHRASGRADLLRRAAVFSLTTTGIVSVAVAFLLILLSPTLSELTAMRSGYLVPAIALMAASVPFLSIRVTLVSLERGLGEITPRVLYSDIAPSLLILTAYIAASAVFGAGLPAALGATLAGNVLATLLLVVHVFRRHGAHLGFGLRFGAFERELASFSVPLFIQGLVALLVLKAHVLILGLHANERTVGVYSSAFSIAQYLTYLAMAVGFIYMPMTAEQHALRDAKAIRKTYESVARWTLMGMLPIVITFAFFPSQIINLMFGAEYVAGAGTLRILALSGLPLALLGPGIYTLIALGRGRSVLISSIVYATANIGLCLILIPAMGPTGAALAFVLSLVLYRLFQAYSLRDAVAPLSRGSALIFIFGGAASCLILAYPASDAGVGEWWWVFIAPFIVLGCSLAAGLATKSLDRNDAALAKKIVGKIRDGTRIIQGWMMG